jgi:hypothetical protein
MITLDSCYCRYLDAQHAAHVDMDLLSEIWIEGLVVAVNVDIVPKAATANQTYLPARADFVDKNGDVARVETIVGSSAASTPRDNRRHLLEAFPLGKFLRICNLPSSTTKPYANVAATFPYAKTIKTLVIQRGADEGPLFNHCLKTQYCSDPSAIISSAQRAAVTPNMVAPRHSMLGVVLKRVSPAVGNLPATYKIITSDLKCELVSDVNVLRCHCMVHVSHNSSTCS